MATSAELFERAIAKDPTLRRRVGGLADAYACCVIGPRRRSGSLGEGQRAALRRWSGLTSPAQRLVICRFTVGLARSRARCVAPSSESGVCRRPS